MLKSRGQKYLVAPQCQVYQLVTHSCIAGLQELELTRRTQNTSTLGCRGEAPTGESAPQAPNWWVGSLSPLRASGSPCPCNYVTVSQTPQWAGEDSVSLTLTARSRLFAAGWKCNINVIEYHGRIWCPRCLSVRHYLLLCQTG